MAKRRSQNPSDSTPSEPIRESVGNEGGTTPASPRPSVPAAAPPPQTHREAAPPPLAPRPQPLAQPAPAAAAHGAHGSHGHNEPLTYGASHGEGDEVHGGHVIISIGTYLKVFAALMVLLIVTLLAAIPDLGPLNLPIALSIAIAKTALIMAFFMHLKFSTQLVKVFGTAAFLWLIILFVLTLNDYWSRNWLLGAQQ